MFTLPKSEFLRNALPKIRVPFVFALLLLSLSGAKCYATTYYVSKNGNNADGLTWATAWNEFDQIKWGLVKAKDIVAIDGGTTSMTYTSTMTIPASVPQVGVGQSGDAGHSGNIILDGTNSKSGIGIDIKGPFALSALGGGLGSPFYVQNFKTAGIRTVSQTACNIELMGIQNNYVGVEVVGTYTVPEYGYLTIHDCVLQNNNLSVDSLVAIEMYEDWFSNTAYPTQAQSGARINGQISNCIFGPGLSEGLIKADYDIKVPLYVSQCLFIDAVNNNIRANNLNSYTSLPSLNAMELTSVTSFMTPLNPSGRAHSCVLLSNAAEPVFKSGLNIYWGGVVNAPVITGLNGQLYNEQYNTTGNTMFLASHMANPNFNTNVGTLPNNASITTLQNTDFSTVPVYGQYDGCSKYTNVSALLAQMRFYSF